jgi:c-di-GMP-binding flagellar brake protein YcgR
MDNNKKYNEKRNFIRMRIDTPADVTLEQSGNSLKGVCRDLSGGGMLIETKTKLDVGLEIQVTLAANHVNSPMLKARAQVARVKTNPTGTYTLGLEILEIVD